MCVSCAHSLACHCYSSASVITFPCWLLLLALLHNLRLYVCISDTRCVCVLLYKCVVDSTKSFNLPLPKRSIYVGFVQKYIKHTAQLSNLLAFRHTIFDVYVRSHAPLYIHGKVSLREFRFMLFFFCIIHFFRRHTANL